MLDSTNKSRQAAEAVLQQYLEEMKCEATRSFGYPLARDIDCEFLSNFLGLPFNNIGDAFVDGTYRIDSKRFEREVLEFHARLTRAPDGDWWGYVTHGGTEGNIFGLYAAREAYPGARVYFSAAAHYSFPKACHLLKLPVEIIECQATDEIDYSALRRRCAENPGMPAIVVANIGTTMAEARDDVRQIRLALAEAGVREYFIHADAALCGGYAAFMEPRPAFDFADGVHSISISGHKFTGVPMPCGVLLTRSEFAQRTTQSVPYLDCIDSTLSGSRNGLTVLALWYAMHTLGEEGLRRRYREAERMAAGLAARLCEAGVAAWRHECALTVVFPRVTPQLQRKWHLASDARRSHLIVMPGTQPARLDEFVDDMRRAARG